MKKIFSIVVFLVIIIPCHLYSQFSGIGNDQRKQSSIVLEPVETLPPLFTDMPYDCMIGYIAMDSIAREKPGGEIINYADSLSLDSLRIAARLMYSVADYSPLLLMRYINNIRDSSREGRYKSSPAVSYFNLEEQLIERRDELGRDYAMVLTSQYIYKVRIDSVVVGIDTTFRKPKDWVNAACTVLDTIKGQYLPCNCKETLPENKVNKQLSNADNCLIFSYPLNRITGTRGSAYDSDNIDRIKTVQKGEIYYIFLEHVSLRKGTDYIHPSYYHEETGGLFLVDDDVVIDNFNFWGLGTEPEINDFHNNLLFIINKIKSWSLQ